MTRKKAIFQKKKTLYICKVKLIRKGLDYERNIKNVFNNLLEEYCRDEEAYVTPVISQSIDERLEILAQKIALNSYKY